MDAVLYIAAALSAVCAVLLVIIIMKLNRPSAQEGQIKELEHKVSSLEGQLRDEFERSRRESAGNQKDMRSELTESLDKMNERLALMTEANFKHQQQLTDMFSKSLDTIRRNNIEQNDRQSRIIAESIEKMQQSNEKKIDPKSIGVGQYQHDMNQKKLDEMRATVDEKLSSTLTTRLDSSFKTVSEQLENVYKSLGEMKELSTGVTTNVTNLNRVLTNVKARGTWAEVQLEGILDQTIPNMYEKNFATRPGSSERVEFAIRIPAGDGGADAYLPVDSKFPMEDYVRLCSAADSADAEEVAKARKALEDRVLGEAKLITKYINVPTTTPFAIMYLATEGLYAEIASSPKGIAERIQREYNIMIAGPTTITALLNSLSMGFKAVAINEKANEVRRLLSVAKAQYEKFGEVLDKAKKKIDEAGRTLVAAQDRNRIMTGKLKGIESMDSAEADAYLGIAEDNDSPEN